MVDAARLAELVGAAQQPALDWVSESLAQVTWERPALAALLKEAQTRFALKPPQLLMPLRLLLTGTTQAPSVDALLFTLGREEARARLAARPAA